MKKLTVLLIAVLAIAGSAYADTSTTASAQGTYPSGTSFNGVPLGGLQIASGVITAADGAAEGHLAISLIGVSVLGAPPQVISVEASATGGTQTAPNVSTISGTCTIDLGTGTPPLTGVPFLATITTDANSQGTVALVLGATTLPAATIGDGSMTIADMGD